MFIKEVQEPTYSDNWLRSAEKFYGFTTQEVLNKGYNKLGGLYSTWRHHYKINIVTNGIYSDEN